jgi:hypothetical protein
MSVSDLFVQSAFSSINPAGMKYKGDWIIAGIYQKDIPLFLVEAVAVAFYGMGVISWML